MGHAMLGGEGGRGPAMEKAMRTRTEPTRLRHVFSVRTRIVCVCTNSVAHGVRSEALRMAFASFYGIADVCACVRCV